MKIPAFGRVMKLLGPNGRSMAASIAHTMMGLGLGKNGCVLWIKGKKSSQFLGVIDDFKNLIIQDSTYSCTCQGRMVHNYFSVGQNDRGPKCCRCCRDDCSGRMTLICNSSFSSSCCCCCSFLQALLVQKKDKRTLFIVVFQWKYPLVVGMIPGNLFFHSLLTVARGMLPKCPNGQQDERRHRNLIEPDVL